MDRSSTLNKWMSDIDPEIYWAEGTDAQQLFANDLKDRFCKKIISRLYRATNDSIADVSEAEEIISDLYYAIEEIDSASWWCDRKEKDEFTIALTLLEDDSLKKIIRKMKRKYAASSAPKSDNSQSQDGQMTTKQTEQVVYAQQPFPIINNTVEIKEEPTPTITTWGRLNKTPKIIIVFFFGMFGVHKFLNKQNKMGTIYLLTIGFIGIGWIHDIIKVVQE